MSLLPIRGSPTLWSDRELRVTEQRVVYLPETIRGLWNNQFLQLPFRGPVLEDDSSNYVRQHLRLEVTSRLAPPFLRPSACNA